MTTTRFPFERERAPFRAVVCTVVPEALALDETQWPALEQTIAVGLAHKPRRIARQLRVFLFVVELLPTARYGQRFSRLTPAQRNTFCSWLEKSGVRLIRKGFWGLRTIALLGYYARPGAAEEVGYRASALGWQARDPARVQT